MIVTRKHPLGGKPLKKGSYLLHSDRAGNFGFMIGYIPENVFTGDKILLPLTEAEDFARCLGCGLESFYERFEPKEKPKEKLRRWLVGLLGGNIVEN